MIQPPRTRKNHVASVYLDLLNVHANCKCIEFQYSVDSYLEHLHDFVTEVVNHLYRNPANSGLSNGREVSLWSDSQASALISAWSVVLTAV